MNTTNNCSEAKKELIPGMNLLIEHMKKQSLEIERLRGENKQFNDEIQKLKQQKATDFWENHELRKELNRSPNTTMERELREKIQLLLDENNQLCKNATKLMKLTKKLTQIQSNTSRGVMEASSASEAEESSASEAEEEEEVKLDWICYEFVRYDYNPEDGSVYDTDGTKIADWDDQGDGKMIWVNKKYEDNHKELAKKSMADIVARAIS